MGPLSHITGMVAALQGPPFLDNILVVGPPMEPPTPPLFAKIVQYEKLDGIMAMPSLLREMARQSQRLEPLRELNFIQ